MSDAQRPEPEFSTTMGRPEMAPYEADSGLRDLADDVREAFGVGLCLVNVVFSEERRAVVFSGGRFEGLIAEVRRSPRGEGLYRRVVETGESVVVEDVLSAKEFESWGLQARHGVRFYAGAPLVASTGRVVGALSLLDARPRGFGDEKTALLSAFARAAAGRLETLGAVERERAARKVEQEYWLNFFQFANDAMVIVDHETGRVLDANDRAGEMYLLGREGFIGADLAGMSVDPEREKGHFGKVVREGAYRGFGSTHRRGDGGTMEVEIDSSVVEHRGRRAVLNVVRDVTERRGLERALREGDQLFRSLVQNASDLITLIGGDGRVRYASPAVERILGYKQEEQVGASAFGLLHPDDAPRARAALSESARTPDNPLTIEVRARHRDGTWRHLEVVGTNLLEDPAVGAIVLNLRDVTARKKAEEALRENERRHAALLSNVPALVYRGLRGPDAPGVFCSSHARELTGYAPEAFVGGELGLQDVVVEKDRERVLREITAALEGRERYEIGYTVRRRDGALRHVEERGHGVYDREGNVRTTEGVIHDVTDLGHAVQRLQEAEKRYRTLVEQIPTVTYIEDYRGSEALRYLSPQYETLLGYPPDEAIRDPDHRLNSIHPDDRERVTSERRRADETGEPFETEYRRISRSGRVVWIHEQAVLVRDDDGRPLFWQGILADVTQRRVFLERLRHMALHDPLTNLPNRHLFTERLEQALRRAAHEGRKLAVLMVDLDDFKRINDSLGHEAGDKVLMAVADRLGGGLRPGDTVSRLGGDEFTVLLEDVREEADATRAAQRIERTLRAPIPLRGRNVVVTPSIGVAFSCPAATDPANPDDLLRAADAALYKAKERGKDRHVVSRSPSGGGPQDPPGPGELAGAIERGELVVHYQPFVSLETGRIVGTEALVRWDHPRYGLLAPSQFIPQAEEDGQIAHVGRWVLAAACRQARQWQDRYPADPPLAMSVNLSASQLKGPVLVEEVAQALAAAGLRPDGLILEITENVAMDDAPLTMSTLGGLRELGVKLAIDDFGSGYSSLSYLKRFPMDVIKIDRSIVTGLDRDTGDRAIVSATITMAHALGLLAVAEGVNSEREAAELRALGCDLGQGPYWWTPRTAALVEILLAENSA